MLLSEADLIGLYPVAEAISFSNHYVGYSNFVFVCFCRYVVVMVIFPRQSGKR